jgi:hypothetical protein
MVVFPLIATLVALGCAVAVALDYSRRPKPDKVAWLLAFVMFAGAAGLEVGGALAHWTPLMARAYYALGAVLVVGYLGLGELYLLFPARRALVDRLAGGLVALSALGVSLVYRAPLDADVAERGWHALRPGGALLAVTIGFNTVGTLVLVGGLLYSAWRFRGQAPLRNRTLGCLLIALGTLAVASGGTLTRLGSDQFLYIAMAFGVALIFAGYVKAKQPYVARQPAAAPSAPPVVASVAATPPVVPAPMPTSAPASPAPAQLPSPAAVNATFVRVGAAGELVIPPDTARRLGLQAGDLAAIVETPDGLLVATRSTFAGKLLDQIATQLADGATGAEAQPPVSVLRGRRSS